MVWQRLLPPSRCVNAVRARHTYVIGDFKSKDTSPTLNIVPHPPLDQDVGASGKVQAQVDRLVSAATLADLVAKTGPDPALKTRLIKAREAAAAAQEASNKASKKKEKKVPPVQGPSKGGKGVAPSEASRGKKPSADATGGPPLKKQKFGAKTPKEDGSARPESKQKDNGKAAVVTGSAATKKPSVVSKDSSGQAAGAPAKPPPESKSSRGSKHSLAGSKQDGSKPSKKPKNPISS